jgi:hypothetical protein
MLGMLLKRLNLVVFASKTAIHVFFANEDAGLPPFAHGAYSDRMADIDEAEDIPDWL